MSRIAVIGSGMAAYGAAYRLASTQADATFFDRNGYFGGHTVSLRYPEGFSFDIGPHVSFTKEELAGSSVQIEKWIDPSKRGDRA